jgi:EVE domain/Meiotically up-regulated gene 113
MKVPDRNASSPEHQLDRQIWLRAFYGFNPESSGYLGFTVEKDRATMISRMREGDLVLIYGAVDKITRPELKSQILGFLEISLEPCIDRDRMSNEAWDWRIENGFENRWNFGIMVKRAWRVNNPVHIKTVAPSSYHNDYRFERTKRAKLLEAHECKRALSHPVRQVNVFGETPIASNAMKRGVMGSLLMPSRGIPPAHGQRSSNYVDGENQLYLMMLSEKAGALLGHRARHADYALAKIGRSNDPKRRLKEINAGFPPSAICRWQLKAFQAFDSADMAHKAETDLKVVFDQKFHSQGGEFFAGEPGRLVDEFGSFCAARLPAILGATIN